MTSFVLFAGILHTLLGLMMFFTALFLILLILIQRGRGGGLSGAFGGMGGQSAFGSKAGDTFTFITIVVATFWIVLCIAGVAFMKGAGSKTSPFGERPAEPNGVTETAEEAAAERAAADDSAKETPDGPQLGEPGGPATPPSETTPSETSPSEPTDGASD